MIDLPPPNYQETIQAIVKCDIPRANINIDYQDDFQSDVVTITDLGAVTDQKLGCLKDAVHPFYTLMIENSEQQIAFFDFSRRVDRPAEKAAAKQWLAEQGLIDRLPRFDAADGIDAFVAALEHACGLQQGSALMTVGSTFVTVRPEFVSTHTFETLDRPLGCLMQMFTASDAVEHGIQFGFIGNEQLDPTGNEAPRKSNDD